MYQNYIVTSLNKNLLDKYAHKFLDSYLKYDIPAELYVYVEDDLSNYVAYHNTKINFINIFQRDLDAWKFVQRNVKKKVIDYRWDSVRFCYKVFAQYLGYSNPGKRMFWIDADCVFVKPIPESWFADILKGSMVAFFDRPNFYSECGFIGYDTKISGCLDFLTEFRRMYISDDIFQEKEFHDSYIFDVVRQWASSNLDTNYTETKLGNPEGDLHIMARDPQVSPYLDHKKGPRKTAEHSPEWLLYNNG